MFPIRTTIDTSPDTIATNAVRVCPSFAGCEDHKVPRLRDSCDRKIVEGVAHFSPGYIGCGDVVCIPKSAAYAACPDFPACCIILVIHDGTCASANTIRSSF